MRTSFTVEEVERARAAEPTVGRPVDDIDSANMTDKELEKMANANTSAKDLEKMAADANNPLEIPELDPKTEELIAADLARDAKEEVPAEPESDEEE